MKMLNLLNLLTLLVSPVFLLAQPNPQPVTGSTNAHDPSICKDNHGTYWLFTTSVGIEIRTSTDRIAWSFIGTVWATGQDTWTDSYTLTSNGIIWAPDCHYFNGEFFLYYAASTFGSMNSGIFFAKSQTGLPGSWTNEGPVTSTSSGMDYNVSDPSLFVDSGGHWYLTLGSFWTGIKQMNLSPSTGKLSNPSITSLSERTADNGAIEAGYIYQNGSFYYLFTSWDLCCKGTSSTYNIRVVRSTCVNGPFTDQSGVAAMAGGGTLVLSTHDSIVGPGGQSVFLDNDGSILVYHYYTSSGSFLGLNHLDFSSGWPVVV
ncbi:glycoside hydrolase family 43 protein [Gautieria morchelliformis]|nr:glycoside hydrolase family 43 protein [Gautieria morchelliformis]